MVLNMNRVVMKLEYRGIIPVEVGMGSRIDCIRGSIWLTEQEGADDVVLDAGDSYAFSRGGVAVVQALREALVSLRAPVPQRGEGIAVRLGRFWRGLAVPAKH